MENKRPKKFSIVRAHRPDCQLYTQTIQGSTGTLDYTVLKIEKEFSDVYTNFYVLYGDDIARKGNPTDDSQDIHDRYENQIGFACCEPGWIADVWVNDGSGKESPTLIAARRCGISTVLTQLCLMDPKLNGMKDGHDSEAYNMLDYYKVDEGYITNIKEDCTQFVGLDMQADPKAAAIGYFSAAIRENYEKMMVQERPQRRPENTQNKRQTFSFYVVQDAKDNYDPNTGNIGPCGCNDYVCKANNAIWFFCK